MAKASAIVVAVVVALLAVLLVLADDGPDASTPRVGGPAPPPAVETPPRARVDSRAMQSREPASDAPVDAPRSTPDEAQSPRPRVRVRIDDPSAESGALVDYEVRVSAAGEAGAPDRDLAIATTRESDCVVELPADADMEDVTEIRVAVASPVHVPTSVRVPWRHEVSPRAPGAEVEVSLERCGFLTGRVDRSPGVAVRLLAFRMNGESIAAEPVDSAWLDEDGLYRLRVPPDSRIVVLAVPRSDDVAPGVVTGSSPEGVARVVSGLRLVDAAVLRGRVVADAGIPVADVGVTATPTGEGTVVRVAGGAFRSAADDDPPAESFVVTESTAHRRAASTRTAEDGTFEIRGLGDVAHHVAAGGSAISTEDLTLEFTSNTGAYATSDLLADRGVDWRPGGADVVLDLRGALLHVSASSGGAAITDFGALVSGRGRSTYISAEGTAYVLLAARPSSTYELQFDLPHDTQRTISVQTGDAGSRTDAHVDVTAAPEPTATLVLRLTGPDGEPLREAHVRLEPRDDPVEREGVGAVVHVATGSDLSRTVTAEDGRFVVDRVPAGRFALSVLPGAWDGIHPARHLWIEDEIRLQDDAVLERTYRAALGGRLEVVARDAAGSLVAADCSVLDSQGRPVPTMFLHEAGSHLSISPALVDDGPSLLIRQLEPGRYRVRVASEGLGEIEKAVDVVADDTARVEFRFDSR